MFSVLVERGGPDAVEFPPCQHGFQDIACIHGSLSSSGTYHRMKLIDKEDDMALGLLNLLEDSLQPFLKLAPILGTGNQGSHVKSNEATILQALRDVSPNHSQGEALHNSRFADPGLPNQDRIILRPPGKDLDDPSDLLIPADNGIELSMGCHIGQISTVALQRLVGILWGLTRYALMPPHRSQGFHQGFPGDSGPGENLAHRAGGSLLDDGQQQMLNADVVVLELL